MKNNLFNLLGILLVGAAFMFTSCEKEDVQDVLVTENFVDASLFSLQERGNLGRFGCYELVFPITIQFADETTATANDYDELRTAIMEWKEANPEVTGKPSFVFPIEVLSEEGDIIVVNDSDELRELKKECKKGWFNGNGPGGHGGNCKPCFDIVFPVTIEFPDETTAEAADRMELKTLVKEWKEANPDSEERPSLVFPIDVEMEDGTIVTVNSKEELIELRESCSED